MAARFQICFMLAALAAQTGLSCPVEAQVPGQEIRGQDGSLFMEEVEGNQKKPSKKQTSPEKQIDFSSLGVPVDPKGRIIPLIQPGAGPVMRNFSRLELEYTPPAVYVPYYFGNYPSYYPYSPYYGYPGYAGYPGYYNPYNSFRSPWYQPNFAGYFAMPTGIPRYYSSSSSLDDPNQELNYNFSGKYLQALPSASVWSPSWRSPLGGSVWLPGITQFNQTGSIRSFFPKELNESNDN